MGKNSKRNARRQPQNGANTGGAASFTQEEIWDDSALIRSWNDALEEYEVCFALRFVCSLTPP